MNWRFGAIATLTALIVAGPSFPATVRSHRQDAPVSPADAVSDPADIAPAQAMAAAGETEGAVLAYIAAASARFDAENLDAASEALEAAVATAETGFGADDVRVARPLASLGRLRIEQGKYVEALVLLDRGLGLRRAGPADPVDEALFLYDRAKAFDGLGRNEEAEVAAHQSYELRRASIGPVHEKTADALNLYANALTAQGRHAEADPAYRQVLGMYEVLFGPTDYHLAIVLSNLGNSLRRTGRGGQADPLYRRAVAIAEVSDDKVLLAQCLTNFGWYLHTQGHGAEAEVQFRRGLMLAQTIVGPDHPFIGNLHANIGYALSDQGRFADAEPEFAMAVPVMEAGLGADSPDIVDSLSGYARVLAALDRPEEAETLYRRVHVITTSRLAPAHPDTLGESRNYAAFLLDQGRPGDALGELRASLGALIGSESGGRDWRTSVRGAGPLFQGRVEAAWQVAASETALTADRR